MMKWIFLGISLVFGANAWACDLRAEAEKLVREDAENVKAEGYFVSTPTKTTGGLIVFDFLLHATNGFDEEATEKFEIVGHYTLKADTCEVDSMSASVVELKK